MWDRKELISAREIQGEITQETVKFAEKFGEYLAKDEGKMGDKPLTTSQLRRFFGEVKRQQLLGYDSTKFVMLKPKLAYAVGRAKQSNKGYNKIEDFYYVLANAIDLVEQAPDKKKAFQNFITAFEAIVAYHKASEKK
jgi:CRISPR type III-A-associated protein Csm2